jgi:hypothetical protein
MIQEERICLDVVRYRDLEGKPTCSLYVPTGKYCRFLLTTRFGTAHTCTFANKESKNWEYLKEDRYIRPFDNCPLWDKEDDNI